LKLIKKYGKLLLKKINNGNKRQNKNYINCFKTNNTRIYKFKICFFKTNYNE